MEKAMESAEKIATLPRTPLRIMKRIVNTHVLSEVPAVLAADAQDSRCAFVRGRSGLSGRELHEEEVDAVEGQSWICG